MKEKLIIKNFGPIKSVDLDLGKMTVLIGEQASGKSTIGKVLAICRYFSYIVNYSVEINELSNFSNNEQFAKGLRQWEIESYLKKDSKIIYENSLYKFEFKNEITTEFENAQKKEYFETHTRIHSKSLEFTELLNQLQSLKKDELAEIKTKNSIEFGYAWSPNENFYRLNVKKVMNNPLFIPTERVIQFQSVGSDLLMSEALRDELSKLNRIKRGFQIEMEIEPLSLIYKNIQGIGAVKKIKDIEFHDLHNGASGYQSIVPIVLAVKFYNGFDKRRRTYIIEEPEQNLFPNAQKKLIEFFTKSINQFRAQFILPTHSPYILTTLSNLIYAYKIGTVEKGKFEKEVDNIISKKFWIDVTDLSVYYLNGGTASNMVNTKDCIINLDKLDMVSEVINGEFDDLLKIEIKYNLNE